MTYEQILKEFDEQFTFTDNWGTFVGWYEQNDGTKGYYTNDKTKSFLKQSFIKYLKDEVERLKTQYQDEHPVDCIDGVTPVETYGYEETYNQAISDQITHLQAQIKELEA